MHYNLRVDYIDFVMFVNSITLWSIGSTYLGVNSDQREAQRRADIYSES